MKQIWTSRMAQAAGKYGEIAPAYTACCNTCRTCVATNLLSLGIAGMMAAGVGIARTACRFVKPS